MAAWNYFISHASEDKLLVAAPLAHVLRDAHFAVWYDDFALVAGDSLSRTIAKGLRGAEYGIVVLSPHFFEKEWPKRELDALTAREGGFLSVFRRPGHRQRIIIPVWYDVTAADIARHAPNLSDRKGIVTDRGLQAVAEQIVRATYPERLGQLPLTNVGDRSDHQEAQDEFRRLLDRNAPIRDIRLFLSAYHSLLQGLVGYHPQLVPAYKLDSPIPCDFALFVPEGITGSIHVQLIALGPLGETSELPQMLAQMVAPLGPRLPFDERAANAYSNREYAGAYAPLNNLAQQLRALLDVRQPGKKNIHWGRPQVWQFSFLAITGRRQIEGIDQQREALLKSVAFPVELASYDRLLD